MAMTKEIMIDGIKVKFKASASIPRLYRLRTCSHRKNMV
jgi:hypothetical protein